MKQSISGIYLSLLLASCAFQLAAQKIDLDKLKNFSPRAIGPAAMSGRITSVDVVASNPTTPIYRNNIK